MYAPSTHVVGVFGVLMIMCGTTQAAAAGGIKHVADASSLLVGGCAAGASAVVLLLTPCTSINHAASAMPFGWRTCCYACVVVYI